MVHNHNSYARSLFLFGLHKGRAGSNSLNVQARPFIDQDIQADLLNGPMRGFILKCDEKGEQIL